MLMATPRVAILDWRPRHISFEVNAADFVSLRIRQHYFHGFSATLNHIPIDLGNDQSTGQIVLLIPPGKGTVDLDLNPQAPEMLGEFISIVALLIIASTVLYNFRLSKRGMTPSLT